MHGQSLRNQQRGLIEHRIFKIKNKMKVQVRLYGDEPVVLATFFTAGDWFIQFSRSSKSGPECFLRYLCSDSIVNVSCPIHFIED